MTDSAAGKGSPPTSPAGDLLAAVVTLSHLHGRPVGEAAIMAGLPALDGKLTPALFRRAAENAGLVAEPAERDLADLPRLILPVVLLMRDGSARILVDLDTAHGSAVLATGTGSGAPARSEIALSQLAADYSGLCFLVRPAPRVEASNSGHDAPKPRNWFWSSLQPFLGNYLHIALASLLINLLALAFPLFVMNVYDRVVPNGALASLAALSIGLVLAMAFDFGLRTARSKMIDLTGKQIDVTLAARLFAHVLGLKAAFRPSSPGGLANQIREFESVREFFTSSTVIAASDMAFSLIFIAMMFLIAGPLAWIPVILLPVTLGIGALLQKPLERAVLSVQAEAAARHGILVESLAAAESIRALGAESRVQAKWERSVAATAQAGEAVHQWSALTLNLSSAAQNMAQLLIVVWGVVLVIDNQISTGALVAATMLSGRIFGPIANLAALVMRGSRTLHTLRAIDGLMRLPVEREPGRVFVSRAVTRGSIRFEQVGFRYPGADTQALTQVSFSIAAGERVGIIGRIGSGKTTMGRLLAGFYEPGEGRVLVDDVDLRQYDPVDLRRGVGFALQDAALFQGSLRDNIAYGEPQASDAEIVAAARLAGVEAFASLAPSGYEMAIVEGGANLSGGQRQSVALARMLLRKPKILFLDEPTSALDLRSETEFCDRLSALAKDTTLIISTHRMSLLRMVDRLIVFDAGRVVADGPRAEVLAQLQPHAATAESR